VCSLIAGAAVVYAVTGPRSDLFPSVAAGLLFQQMAWVIAVCIASAPDVPRLRNPATVVLALAIPYFLYPGMLWCRTGRLPFLGVVQPSSVSRVFVAHGLFMLALALAYRLTRRSGRSGRTTHGTMPSAWPLVSIALTFIGVSILVRMLSGGGILPNQSYGDEWNDIALGVASARNSGGVGYVFVQIMSKVNLYPIMLLGVAITLLLGKFGRRLKGQLGVLLACGALTISTTWLMSGARSPAIIVFLIAVIYADMIGVRLRWSVLLPGVVVMTVLFGFLGYMRVYRDLSIIDAASNAYTEMMSGSEEQNAGEFAGMLSKEIVAKEMYADQPPAGFQYIFESVLAVVPSQLLPSKLNWEQTNQTLSNRFLGGSTTGGGGVAGTMIGDCYRFAGSYGVIILPAILGFILATVERWTYKGGASMMKLALAASFYSMSFMFIRGSLGEVIVNCVYGVIVPSAVAAVLLSRSHPWMSRWQTATQRFRIRVTTQTAQVLGGT
jgi:oligosaccharide repeat unit polymerase